ncbi:MAG: NADAR family protein [Dehalococcoidales bacterium]|nr:NADAR family protein [Dehalococcoidales bacterium]
MSKISVFGGSYAFLSNFYRDINGNCVEIEYQSAKATNEADYQLIIASRTSSEAKRLGRRIICRKDWDIIKLAIMYRLVKKKFSIEPLRSMLIDTGNMELIEGNYWNDTYWGVCKGVGKNHLGNILMCVRSELQEHEKQHEKSFSDMH